MFSQIPSDGGLVATNSETYGPGLSKWGDKCYDRVTGGRAPEELAANYRMSEPQSAVAAAQMGKLTDIVTRRNRAGELLGSLLSGTPGLLLPTTVKGDFHSYWFYLFRLELPRFTISRNELAAALNAEGVAAGPGYIPTTVYQYPVFQNHNFFGGTWPARLLGQTSMDYRQVSCPVAEAIIRDCITLRINEAMSDAYIEKVGRAIRTVAARFSR